MKIKHLRFFALSVPTSSKKHDDVLMTDLNSNTSSFEKIKGPGFYSYRTGGRTHKGDLTSEQEVNYRLAQISECLEQIKNITQYEEETLSIFMCPEFYLQGPMGVIEFDHVAKFYALIQFAINKHNLNNCLIVPGTTIVKGQDKDGLTRTHNIIALFFKGNIHAGVKINTSGIDIIGPDRDGGWNGSGSGFLGGEITTISKDENSLNSKSFTDFLKSIRDEMKIWDDRIGGKSGNLFHCTQPYIDIDSSVRSGGRRGRIRVGWEICLDHLAHELRNSIGSRNTRCDIQLIPSCGMWPKKGCLFLKENGIFFNVDGMKGRMGKRTSVTSVVNEEDVTIKKAERELSTEVLLGRVHNRESENSYVEIDYTTMEVKYVNCLEINIGNSSRRQHPISETRGLLKWSDELDWPHIS